MKGFNSDHLKNKNKGFLNKPKVEKKKIIYVSLCDLFKL